MSPARPPTPSLHTVEPLDLDSLASSLDLSLETRTSVASLIESWDSFALHPPLPTRAPPPPPTPSLCGPLVKLWESLTDSPPARPTPPQPPAHTPHVDMDLTDSDVSLDADLDDVRRLISARKRARDPDPAPWGHCTECGRARDRPHWPPFAREPAAEPPSVRRLNTAPLATAPPPPVRPAPLNLNLSPPAPRPHTRRLAAPARRRLDLPLEPRSPPVPAQRRCITRDPKVDRQLAYWQALETSPVTPVARSPAAEMRLVRGKMPQRERVGTSVARRLSYQEVREARRKKLVEEQRRVNSKLKNLKMRTVPKNTRLPTAARKEDRSGGNTSPTDVRARWR